MEESLDIQYSWTSGRSLVLYGAGNVGKQVAKALQVRDINVAAFIDARAKTNETINTIPVYNLTTWRKYGKSSDTDILITIRNGQVNLAPIIDELKREGFAHVLNIVDYVNMFPGDLDDPFWLAPKSYYADKHEKLAAARDLLADDLSRTWFDTILGLRLDGNYHNLPEPCYADQYMPGDLPRWANPMRLLDCGAYDGDTIEAFLKEGYNIDAVAAFEPDPDSYAKLVTRFPETNRICLPCGVSSSAQTVSFDGGLGTGSRIGQNGLTTIQCVSLDDTLPLFSPTLIKMDIEGAEPAALRGAERTLRKYRPGLAIAVYHAPEHLWEIPLWLSGLGLGYRMHLRGHNHSGYDLVLYCYAN